ncbi:MAG: DUF2141 domain-containing protein [Saprospiraceae bacterium]|nr:DUF2141 domain-containing protein [Saprospiraceae bacterium]
MKIFLFIICSAIFVFHPVPEEGGSNLTLLFQGIERAGGTVRLAMYGSKVDFMLEEKAMLYNFKVDKKGTLEVVIENLPIGSHAFAVFLDENNNMVLDKNLMGVPTEPYGFSKEPPSKWRLPTWEEAVFEHRQSGKAHVVSLKRWALF